MLPDDPTHGRGDGHVGRYLLQALVELTKLLQDNGQQWSLSLSCLKEGKKQGSMHEEGEKQGSISMRRGRNRVL